MDSGATDNDYERRLKHLVEKPVPLVRYAAVRAVILHWEDSDRLEDYVREAEMVESFFKEGLKFDTQVWAIPSNHSQIEMRKFVMDQQALLVRRMALLDAPCLLIIHYGGHGDKDDDIHYTGPGGPQQRRAVWRAQREGGPSVRWYEVQQLFIDVPFDVLLLLDCCHAAQAGRDTGDEALDKPPSGVELLAAAGDKAETPHPGDLSFTNGMIKLMKEWIKEKKQVKISELHAALVHRKADLYTTPFHVHLRAGPSERSVVLEKLPEPGEQTESMVAWRAAVSVTIGMREPLTHAILKNIGRWLFDEAPNELVAGLKVERVLTQTANINDFIGNSLPMKSGAVAQYVDIPVLKQISEVWNSLEQHVTRYKSRLDTSAFAELEDRKRQFDDDLIKTMNACNMEITQLLQKVVMFSDASSNPAMIDRVLDDPASELFELKSHLVLRKIICRQQEPELKGKVAATRSVTRVAPDRVMEEYKKYDEHRSPGDIKDMKARIALLANLLEVEKPESFRCLQLHDWKHEEHDRRFVYHFLIPNDYKKKSITLYDAVMNLNRHLRPTLEERLTMAYDIAKAVEQWHRVDWVHQSISSHNIVFLKPVSGDTSDRWAFDSPYLHGFDFARPNAKASVGRYVENIELDIYRHPDRQGEVRDGHKKEHDLYSLGVVLLEIGLWKSCRDTIEKRAKHQQKGYHKHATVKDRHEQVAQEDMVKWLKDTARESLAHYVGSDYRDAVLTCLESDFGVTQDDERKSKLLDAMDRTVLRKLERRRPNA
ncbi:hypothetical protein ACET3X_004799 [Alternaria dauci]|uniref:Protein kinase domain-containing protein n=1 Tax=Alternaria dauci TaxID=48095 RepID=A0ABR3UK79_9PLEO